MSQWIDAHCHLADPRFDADRDQVIARSRAAGVSAWVQGGVSPADWELQKKLISEFGAGVVPVLGLHPWWVHAAAESAIEQSLSALAAHLSEARALGELGLDALPRNRDSLPKQQGVFEKQLRLASQARLPIVLHVVNAHEAALAILERHAPYPLGGLVHAFSSSIEVARRYLDLGLHISAGSGLRRPGFNALKKALPLLPADRLLLETDAPDGLPGERQEPAGLIQVAEAAAALRGETAEGLLTNSARTLRKIFKME